MKFSFKRTNAQLFSLTLIVIKSLPLFITIIFISLFFPYYIQTEIYDFQETVPFSGDSYYNPYKNWQRNNNVKANFHAHSKAWLGVTNGENSIDEISKAYKAKSYGVSYISNYQSIKRRANEPIDFLPIYEHGYNLRKTHQLAIGTAEVVFFDFPFSQNLSQKQLVINKLKEHSKFVCLAHPAKRNGYTKTDLISLTNYEFMEVISPVANSTSLWDTALSHGIKVWGMMNDDLHDISESRFSKYYNVLSGQASDSSRIENVLRDGCFYALNDMSNASTLSMNHLTMNDDTLEFEFNGLVKEVKVISDNVLLRSFMKGSGRLSFPKTSHYIRLEVSDNTGNLLLTNPVIREMHSQTVKSHYIINGFKTMLYRMAVLCFTILLLFICFSKVTVRVNFEVKNLVFRLSKA